MIESSVFSSVSEIHQAHESLGQLENIKLEADSIPEAHFLLGGLLSDQIIYLTQRKIDNFLPDRLPEELNIARGVLVHLQELINRKDINPSITNAVSEYLDSLKSWSEAAGLEDLAQKINQNGIRLIDGTKVNALDLAILDQNDNVGCQTGMIRKNDGSVLFWHVEEEPDNQRIDKARIIEFCITGEKSRFAFCYPDLLPGPAFGFSDDFFQAVDYIPLTAKAYPALANITTWIIWRLGNFVNAADIIRTIGPYIDGYALHIIKNINGFIQAKRIEFYHELLDDYELSNEAGKYIFGTNTITKHMLDQNYCLTDSIQKAKVTERLRKTDRAISLISQIIKDIEIPHILRLLEFRLGCNSAYANSCVKAHAVGILSSDRIIIDVGAGPASKSYREEHFMLDNKKIL